MTAAQAIGEGEKSSAWDFFDVLDMALACFVSYCVTTHVLSPFIAEPDALLGGMWATVATVFVFRETRASSLAAGVSRLIATGVSFALCLAYLLALPFHPAGLGRTARRRHADPDGPGPP